MTASSRALGGEPVNSNDCGGCRREKPKPMVRMLTAPMIPKRERPRVVSLRSPAPLAPRGLPPEVFWSFAPRKCLRPLIRRGPRSALGPRLLSWVIADQNVLGNAGKVSGSSVLPGASAATSGMIGHNTTTPGVSIVTRPAAHAPRMSSTSSKRASG